MRLYKEYSTKYRFYYNYWPTSSGILHLGIEGDGVTEEEIKEQEKRMLDGTPLGRIGKLSEVADVVVYLCSTNASYITGTVVSVDGGRLQ